jgi:hypothetical protein
MSDAYWQVGMALVFAGGIAIGILIAQAMKNKG